MDGATCNQSDCATAFRVLLVDDNHAFRLLISKQLEAMGCVVQTTPDASRFLGELMTARDPFDLAVVDINLPDMRGDMIISWLRESELSQVRSMPVLVVTGSPSGVAETLPKDAAHINMLPKPYKFSDLERAVSKLLGDGGTQH